MRRLGALALLVAASGCAGAYGLSYTAQHGAAMAPPTTTRGTATALRYRDYGGILSKALLLLGTVPPEPTTTKSLVDSKTECYSTYCETTETYRVHTPSEEEMADWGRRVEDWSANVAPAILSGGIAAEASVDWASRKLGGDTDGWSFYFGFRRPIRKLFFFDVVSLSFGAGGTRMTMHGRSRQVVEEMNGVVHARAVTEDLTYVHYGFPTRVTGLIGTRLAFYLQLDLNMQPLLADTFDERAQPQITRLGVQTFLSHIFLSGELSADGFRPGSLTFGGEVGLAF